MCQNNGTCVIQPNFNDSKCACASGWTGATCEQPSKISDA